MTEATMSPSELRARRRQQRNARLRKNIKMFTSNRLGVMGVICLLLIAAAGITHSIWLNVQGPEYHPTNMASVLSPAEEMIELRIRELQTWEAQNSDLAALDEFGQVKAVQRYLGLAQQLQQDMAGRINEIEAEFKAGEETYQARRQTLLEAGLTGTPSTIGSIQAPRSEALSRGIQNDGPIVNTPAQVALGLAIQDPSDAEPQEALEPESDPVDSVETPSETDEDQAVVEPTAESPAVGAAGSMGESEPDEPSEPASACECQPMSVELPEAQPAFGAMDPLLDLEVHRGRLQSALVAFQEGLRELTQQNDLSYILETANRAVNLGTELAETPVMAKLRCSNDCLDSSMDDMREKLAAIRRLEQNYNRELNPFPHGPTLEHPFGVTNLGMDVFSQFTSGAIVAITLGVLCALAAVVIGTFLGLLSGFRGGMTDAIIMRTVDIFLATPVLPVLIVITAILQTNSIVLIGMVIVLFAWPSTARVIRSQVLSLRSRPFVEGAKMSGAKPVQVVLRHVLPNVLPLALLSMTFSVYAAILAEASLSALGLGDHEVSSWGRMIYEVRESGNLDEAIYWLLPPGLGILVLCLAFVLIGRAMEEIINPRLRKRGA